MGIAFRPHHFLCALCFKGSGYSPAFVANFYAILAELETRDKGDQTPITVLNQTDSICRPCPHRRKTVCATEDKIAVLDHAHAKALDIEPGEIHTWGEMKARIAQKISLAVFHQICATCEWKKLGICENVVKNLSE